MKNIFSAFLLLFILSACSTDRTYYLETRDANGVEEGAKVYRQGVEIGEVTEVKFVDQNVRIGISTDSPLFEGQDFSIGRGQDGEQAVELDQPASDAEELADGEILEDDAFGISFEGDLEEVFGDTFGPNGEKLEAKIEEVFGKDGEKIEAKIEELFGKDGEKLEASIENIFGKDGENLTSAIESVIGKDGEKIQESIEMIIGKDGEKIENWAKAFGGEFEELGEKLEAVNDQYEKDSPEWKQEMRKVFQEWADDRE